MKTCSFEGCGRKHYAHGLCKGHRQRQYLGKPLTPIIPRSSTIQDRFDRKVNKGAECWQWDGATTDKGYGEMRINGKLAAAHRISYELHVGPIPEGLLVDHRCHNKACVNPAHLRAIPPKGNSENRSGPRAGSKSGVWGVSWNKKNRRWSVKVRHHGIDYSGGHYTDLNEAAEAAKQLRLSLFQYNDVDRRKSA